MSKNSKIIVGIIIFVAIIIVLKLLLSFGLVLGLQIYSRKCSSEQETISQTLELEDYDLNLKYLYTPQCGFQESPEQVIVVESGIKHGHFILNNENIYHHESLEYYLLDDEEMTLLVVSRPYDDDRISITSIDLSSMSMFSGVDYDLGDAIYLGETQITYDMFED